MLWGMASGGGDRDGASNAEAYVITNVVPMYFFCNSSVMYAESCVTLLRPLH